MRTSNGSSQNHGRPSSNWCCLTCIRETKPSGWYGTSKPTSSPVLLGLMPRFHRTSGISFYLRPNWLINLLRQATINQKISTWEYFNGPFDFNEMLLAPVGCRVLIHTKPRTRRSWDYRAKQGFYTGPAFDHYRCYKLVKSETKQKVISNTVEFRHAYLQIPAVSVNDKIINGLQVMAGALRNAPPPTSCLQLDGIEMLLTLLEKWERLAPPVLQTDSHPVCIPLVLLAPMPSSVQDMAPAPNLTNNPFHALANDDDEDEPSAKTWVPPPLPTSVPRTPAPRACVAPYLQATPMRLVFDNVASPSGPNTTLQPSPSQLPRVLATPIPIAHRTRSCLAPPHHNSLVALVQYHIPMAKTTWSPHTVAAQFAGLCQALALLEPESTEVACLWARLTSLDEGHSLTVLGKESGQLLEHCQVQQDPSYEEVWDWLCSNELGWLCQGIGTGDKAGGHLNRYSDIPHYKQKEIIYTKVVCEIQEGKDDNKLYQDHSRWKLNFLSRWCRHQYSIVRAHQTHP